MVTRVFVGWDQPFARVAADHLLAQPDLLPGTLVIVPTSQAGRQLLRLMAHRAGAILSPRTSTPGALLETPDPDIAPPWVERLAWQETLEHTDRFPTELFSDAQRPEGEWAGNLAAELVRLRRKLQENGLTLQTAARQLGNSIEGERWQALATLEQQMEQVLRQWKYRSRSRVLAEGIHLPHDIERIVVAGVTEIPPLLIRALESWNGPVTCLIAAPADHETHFSPIGIPHPHWSEIPIPWPENGAIHVTADIRQQAQRSLDTILDAGTTADDIAIGCADTETGEALRDILCKAGWIAHHPAGTTAITGLIRFLHVWSLWLKETKLSHFADLLALPETQHLIETDRSKLAQQLSRLRDKRMLIHTDDLRHFAQQKTYANDTEKHHTQHILKAAETLEQWRAMCLRKDFIPSHLRLIDTLCTDAITNDAQTLIDWLLQAEPLAARLDRSATFWIDLMLSEQNAPGATPPDGRIIDIQGWLELLFSPGSHLVVCGINEGLIPATQSGDPWLGEAAKTHLGLPSDQQRATRDAFLLRSMIESRRTHGRVDLICARTKSNGESLLPSRLLLASPIDELPQRVQHLFRQIEPPDARLRWQTDWKWTPPAATIPDRFRTTSMGDYLSCPFRFYLKHIVRMRDSEPDRIEWNARDFGTTTHAILERWAKDTNANTAADADSIHDWLNHDLDETVKQHFGKRIPLAVRLQIESMRQRLRWFAEQQALIRQDGWQIERTEHPFEIRISDCTLSGTIDRIDHHPELQAWRVIDYKTGKDKGTASAHQTRVNSNSNLPAHLNEDCPAIYTRTEGQKSPQTVRWTNLQLPLYVLALQQQQQSFATPCYFKLGETAAQVHLDPWDSFTPEDLQAAEACCHWIIQQIRAGIFSPPAESVTYDDFEILSAGRPLQDVFKI